MLILKMPKYKISLQYTGTRYAGWQIQKHGNTIQGELTEAIRKITRETVSVVGAGRTDSGVHAVEQVAHFRVSKRFPPEKLFRGINAVLPRDIRVVRIKLAPPGFHARRQAVKKRYEYRIYTGDPLSPFLCGQVWHHPRRLDISSMERAAEYLCGSHDFTGFAASRTTVPNRVRCVYLSRVAKRGHQILYRVEANGFLHHMVRNIVGTLIEIGNGKRPPEDMLRVLESKDRRLAGPTAPAEGLYLMKVWY